MVTRLDNIRLSLELSWYWFSMLGDLVDSLNISLDIGLSIILKAGAEQLRWLWGGRSSVVRAPAAKAGDPGSIPGSCLGFFFFSWLTNVDGMKDLWCSSTVWQLAANQHRYEWGEGSMVL